MKVKGNNGGDFQMPEPGTYLARCIKVVDLGTQASDYQGKALSRRQVVLGWELPTELIESGEYAGQPFVVTKFYTASLNEKANLRHDLTTWRGRDFTPTELEGFDLANILGVACLITLTETESGKRKVSSVSKPPKGTTVPPQVNPSINFSLERGEYDADTFASLSDWFRETIAKSPEYADLNAPFADVDFAADEDLAVF